MRQVAVHVQWHVTAAATFEHPKDQETRARQLLVSAVFLDLQTVNILRVGGVVTSLECTCPPFRRMMSHCLGRGLGPPFPRPGRSLARGCRWGFGYPVRDGGGLLELGSLTKLVVYCLLEKNVKISPGAV